VTEWTATPQCSLSCSSVPVSHCKCFLVQCNVLSRSLPHKTQLHAQQVTMFGVHNQSKTFDALWTCNPHSAIIKEKVVLSPCNMAEDICTYRSPAMPIPTPVASNDREIWMCRWITQCVRRSDQLGQSSGLAQTCVQTGGWGGHRKIRPLAKRSLFLGSNLEHKLSRPCRCVVHGQ
jgi:hypothetical protein